MAKSTVWYILRKKEHAWQQKKVADDRRILSIVKKNPFTTSSQEVGVSLSKSTIKRRLHDSKYRRFTTRFKPFTRANTDGSLQGSNYSQVSRIERPDFAQKKKSKKSSPVLKRHSLDRLN